MVGCRKRQHVERILNSYSLVKFLKRYDSVYLTCIKKLTVSHTE